MSTASPPEPPAPPVREAAARHVLYVRHFCKELAPPLLRAAAALNGFQPPADDDFDYADVGCGRGETLMVLAAAHPRARFVGVDYNPQHVADARARAAAAGLSNVRFVEADFDRMTPGELGELDYVCADGVISWIAPATRARLVDLAAASLRPGGLLLLGYNALPGWAVVAPLRRFLRDMSAGLDGDDVGRARHGVAMARLFRDAGAAYFAANPAVSEMIDTMERLGPGYVIHEYFGEAWQPLHFGDVAVDAGRRGLRFAGQLPLYMSYRDLVVPPGTEHLFHRMTDRVAYEGLKDYAINEFYRRDLYVKETVRHDATARRYLATTRFGTLLALPQLKRAVQLRYRTLTYEGPLFDALLARLAAQPGTLDELAADPALASFGVDALRDAVLRVLLGDQATPLRAAPEKDAAVAAHAYNRTVLEQPLSPRHACVLASPEAGTGVPLSELDALALRALTLVPVADREPWVRSVLATSALRVHDGARIVDDPDEKALIVLAHVERFRRERLGKLVALKVTPPPGEPAET